MVVIPVHTVKEVIGGSGYRRRERSNLKMLGTIQISIREP